MSTDSVCDDNSFQAVPEQPPETLKWKNLAGKEMVWANQQPFVQNPNPKHAGRRLLKDLSTVCRPTLLAKNSCDTLEVDGHRCSSPRSCLFYQHQNQQTS